MNNYNLRRLEDNGLSETAFYCFNEFKIPFRTEIVSIKNFFETLTIVDWTRPVWEGTVQSSKTGDSVQKLVKTLLGLLRWDLDRLLSVNRTVIRLFLPLLKKCTSTNVAKIYQLKLSLWPLCLSPPQYIYLMPLKVTRFLFYHRKTFQRLQILN